LPGGVRRGILLVDRKQWRKEWGVAMDESHLGGLCNDSDLIRSKCRYLQIPKFGKERVEGWLEIDFMDIEGDEKDCKSPVSL
jgi:hypothetical protein